MPTAWKQYQEELPGRQAREEAFENCKVPLEFYGREEENIAVADVISRRGPIGPEYNYDWSARLRVIRSIKGQLPWAQNQVLTASESGDGEDIHGWGSMDMVAGKRYILFGEFQEDQSGRKALVLDNCGVVPYNEQKLSAIQRGIDASLARHIPER